MSQIPPLPQFGQAPLIGQREKHVQTQVQAAIAQLSQGIYVQLASGHVATRNSPQAVDPEKMRQLAKNSVVAARCYFEGVGVIKQEDSP
jgi:hypothetical protein